MNSKQLYILNLEASDIYNHIVRNKEIESNYSGMIPFSLELLKLKKEGISIQKVKYSEREFTNDIINVKFNHKVRGGNELIKIYEETMNNLLDYEDDNFSLSEKDHEYIDNLELKIAIIKSEIDNPKWNEVRNDKLREELYLNGFTLTDENGKETNYVVYKRSSSKSRTGQCLFIKESLYDEMINWSRMYLPFKKDMDVDYASLLAYESLVLSSIEDTIHINPKNILIIDDVESKFDKVANVVKKGEDGYLDSFREETTITNSLFDGESLLDSQYFTKGQSMKLLRNHMFKSAAFNTNIQMFLEDHCPDGVKFDEWELKDMFGYPILAKDVHLICTPSSLKALKFSHVVGSEKEMWNYWQELVDKEGCLFGVCKHEKPSKRGTDSEGNILQRTSYQMLNSLPMSEHDAKQLIKIEEEYINKLKNDDDSFIEYVLNNANDINSNEMFAAIYSKNKDIVNTKLFRDFKKSEINKYVTNCKRGKIRLQGDYCVMLGNPMEFLYHAIGQFDDKTLSLKENEIYTTLFDFDKELVGFRNPNTSPSNVLVAKNTYSKEINKYFNLTDNIVCVNAVGFELQDLLSGCDYDSDTLVLFDDETLLKLGKQCFGKYPVCINQVESQKKKYRLNKYDMSLVDNQLAQSKDNIGIVVNLGQLCMSTYWDLLHNGETEGLDELLKKVEIMTVLSGICIDMAKKFYEIDIRKEISNVQNAESLKQMKPIFFKYFSKNENIKDKVQLYDCPMDYLNKILSELGNAKHHENVDFLQLVIKRNIKKGDRKQEQKILTDVELMCEKIKGVNARTLTLKEKNTLTDNVIKFFNYKVSKKTVKPDTMYAILVHLEKKNNSKNATKLLNTLYLTQRDVFLNAFKQK